jgi:hypothetical protein
MKLKIRHILVAVVAAVTIYVVSPSDADVTLAQRQTAEAKADAKMRQIEDLADYCMKAPSSEECN